MIRRSGIEGIERRFLLAALAATVALSRAGAARASAGPPVVGFVGFGSVESDAHSVAIFRQAMRDLGHVEGRTYRVESRSTGGDVQKGHALLAELAALPVAVFLSPGQAATRAIHRMSAIPIVAIALPPGEREPELFASLSRPGGTVTGFSAFGEDMSAKRIEILREIMPGLTTLGVLHNATDPTFRAWGEETIASVKRHGIHAVRLALTSSSGDQAAEHVRALRAADGTALIVIRDFLTSALLHTICTVAGEERIAVIAEDRAYVEGGALLSCGADIGDLFRRAATYVDRILRGDRPGDLPIQLPTKIELVLNMRAARALGIDMPAAIFARADEVVE